MSPKKKKVAKTKKRAKKTVTNRKKPSVHVSRVFDDEEDTYGQEVVELATTRRDDDDEMYGIDRIDRTETIVTDLGNRNQRMTEWQRVDDYPTDSFERYIPNTNIVRSNFIEEANRLKKERLATEQRRRADEQEQIRQSVARRDAILKQTAIDEKQKQQVESKLVALVEKKEEIKSTIAAIEQQKVVAAIPFLPPVASKPDEKELENKKQELARVQAMEAEEQKRLAQIEAKTRADDERLQIMERQNAQAFRLRQEQAKRAQAEAKKRSDEIADRSLRLPEKLKASQEPGLKQQQQSQLKSNIATEMLKYKATTESWLTKIQEKILFFRKLHDENKKVFEYASQLQGTNALKRTYGFIVLATQNAEEWTLHMKEFRTNLDTFLKELVARSNQLQNVNNQFIEEVSQLRTWNRQLYNFVVEKLEPEILRVREQTDSLKKLYKEMLAKYHAEQNIDDTKLTNFDVSKWAAEEEKQKSVDLARQEQKKQERFAQIEASRRTEEALRLRQEQAERERQAQIEASRRAETKISSIPTPLTVTQLQGPVTMSEHYRESDKARVYVLGDIHERFKDGQCTTPGTTLSVLDWVKRSAQTNMVDLHLELAFQIKGSKVTPVDDTNDQGYLLNDLNKQLQDLGCLTTNKSDCKLKSNNVRVHYDNIREIGAFGKELYRWASFVKHLLDMWYQAGEMANEPGNDGNQPDVMKFSMKEFPFVLDDRNIQKSLDDHFKTFKPFDYNINKMLEELRVNKEINQLKNQADIKSVNKMLQTARNLWVSQSSEYQDVKQIVELLALAKKDASPAEIDKLKKPLNNLFFKLERKAFSNLQSSAILQDAYMFARMLKPNGGQPRNIVVYVGNAHAQSLREALSSSEFEQRFNRISPDGKQCIPLRDG